MFCEKCGRPLAEGERFCGNCGSPVVIAQQPAVQPQEPAVQASPAEQPNYAEYAFQQTAEKKPRKKVNGKRIAIIAGAVVGCIGIFIAIGFATGLFKSWFKSDKDRVSDVTTGTVHKIYDFYNNMAEEGIIDELSSLSVKIEPGQALKAAAFSKGIDLNWLNSVSFDTATTADDGVIKFGGRLSLNDTEITTVNAVVDLNKREILFGADGLSDSIARIDLSSFGGNMSMISAVSGEGIGALFSELDVEELVDLFEDYLDAAISALDDVDKSSGTITAAGVTGDCTVYTIKISEKTIAKMEKALIEKAVDDSDLKDLLEKIYPMISSSMGAEMDFDQFYDQAVSMMNAMLESFDQQIDLASDSTIVTVIEYADGDDLVGLSLFSGSQELFCGFADGGDQFGIELSVGGRAIVSGSGTKDGDVLNGTIELMGLDGASFLSIKLDDFDYKAGEGTIEIPIPSAALSGISADASTTEMLQDLTLKIVIKDHKVSIDAVVTGMSLVKVTFGTTANKPAAFDTSKAVKSMNEWPSTLKFDVLKSRLQAAGMPDAMLEMAVSSMSVSGFVPAGDPYDTPAEPDEDDPFYGEDNIRLTVWTASAAESLTKDLCSEFIGQYPQKNISITVKPMEVYDAYAQVVNDPNAAADVFGFASDQLNSLNKASVLSSPEDYGNYTEVWMRDSTASVNAATLDGELLAYPQTGENGYYLIYDKRIVSDADAETLEGVLAACKKAGKKFIMDAGNGYYACMFMFTGGLTLEGTDIDGIQQFNYYDEDEVIDSLVAFNKLVSQYSGTFQSDNVDKILSGMQNNTVGAGFDGSWNAARARDILGDNYGAVKLPTIKINGSDTQIVSMNGYKFVGVNNYTSYPEAAHLLAKYLTDEDAQMRFAEVLAWSPSNLNVAGSYVVSQNIGTIACLEQAEYSVPQVDIANTFWTPVGSLGNYICTKGTLTRAQIETEFEKAIANIKDE